MITTSNWLSLDYERQLQIYVAVFIVDVMGTLYPAKAIAGRAKLPHGCGMPTPRAIRTEPQQAYPVELPPQKEMSGGRNTSIILATSLSGMSLFGMLLIGCSPKRRSLLSIMLGIVVVVMVMSLVACGGSNNTTKTVTIPGTPSGSYKITLTSTGTAGSYDGDTSAHTMTVTLTVQ